MPPDPELNDLLTAAGDAAYDWDISRDAMRWYGATPKIFGGILPPVDSQGLYRLLHPEDRHIFFSGENSGLDRSFRLDLGVRGILWIHERAAVETDEEKTPIRQKGVWRLREQPAHLPARRQEEALDLLTDCLKRAPFESCLTRVIVNARLANRVAACLAIGVDKMAFVNDAVGTHTGDALLRGVATRLSHLIPASATLGRLSGDVFGILLPEPLGNEAPKLSERILQDFRDAPVLAAGTLLHITVSIGGVRMPSVARSAGEAMIFAEQALHMARQSGRDTFTEYLDNPGRIQENRQLMEMGERIKRAFKTGGFRMAYQPIVAADTGKPVLYETLVRMFADDGKPIPAANFVPAIEQMGLSNDLDRLVLDMAIRDMTECPDLCLSINVSGLTVSRSDWPLHVRRVLEHHPDIAQRLVMEITETAAIADIVDTLRFIETLRELGGRIALDDFGAGATSIRYLRDLDLSLMKLDKELIKDVTTHPEQNHLVTILIELAHGLGIQTVAEGIETAEAAACLRAAHVDYLQGYYFGKPSLERPESTQAESRRSFLSFSENKEAPIL